MQHLILGGGLRDTPIGLSTLAMADVCTCGSSLNGIESIHPHTTRTDTAGPYGPFHSEEIFA
ncbi:hypothetical protein [Streptosporangium roseum]|uniref:hypothetical protein n=1 Tax=Streptosporangium roseum TaxID=2001 RepID=UPI0033271878